MCFVVVRCSEEDKEAVLGFFLQLGVHWAFSYRFLPSVS